MTAFLVPPIPAQMWTDAGYGDMISMVVGTDVQQVFSLGQAAALDFPAGTIVMYDVEPLETHTTPKHEATHAKPSMQKFVKLAHSRSWKAMIAPARSLGLIQSRCPPRPGENENDTFLRCGLASVKTDYFLLQSQRMVCDTDAFAAFVAAAAARVQGKLIIELTLGWSDSRCLWKDGGPGAIKLLNAAYDSSRHLSDLWALWGAGTDASPFFDHVRAVG